MAEADVQTASAPYGIFASQGGASGSPPPLPSSSPPLEGCDAPVVGGKKPRAPYQHCSPRSTASQASGLTDLSQSAQNLPDPGQYRLIVFSV